MIWLFLKNSLEGNSCTTTQPVYSDGIAFNGIICRKPNYLKVNQLGNVGVSDEHLMQQTADETLHLPQIAEQTSLWLSSLHAPLGCRPQASLFRFPWHGSPNAPQQAVCGGPQLLLFGVWQAHLQQDLDCCAVLELNKSKNLQ